MNHIVVFRKGGLLSSLFFAYRDESDVVYETHALIRNVDDVIEVMEKYFLPDDNVFVVRETLLDATYYRENNLTITEQLRKYLDE